MVRLNSTAARSAAALSALLVVLIIGFFIVKPFVADIYLSKVPSRPELSRALTYDNLNPSHHYRLALHYYYDPTARDLPAALASYRRAISLNPVNAMYWIGLANVYESMGQSETARSSLARALYLNPTYAKSRWMMVNLELREGGSIEKLVSVLGGIIKDFPKERVRAFSVLHRVTNNDVDRILADAIPEELETMVKYLDFLISRKDSGGVKSLWNAISENFEIKREDETKYINYLVSVGRIREARRYWAKSAAEREPGSNIILNSGFESDICENRLCWKLRKLPGATSGIDELVSFEGKRSLKIEFDGSANINFYHVSTVVPLETGRSYILSAFIKTDKLTTTNGFFLEIYGIGGCKFSARTDVLTGTNSWRESSVDITPPSGCTGAVVRLRRLKSTKLDNLIKGRLWLDEVSLELLGASPRHAEGKGRP